MKMATFLTTALFASAAALSAQGGNDGKLVNTYISFGFNLAQGHAHDMTQKTWGGVGAFNGELGLDFKYPGANLKIRPNMGYGKILAGNAPDADTLLYDLEGVYGGIDFVYAPFANIPLSLSTGPSLHTWHVSRVDNPVGDPNQGESGVKFGWRLGAGYRVMDNIRVDLVFTQTEWRTIKNSTNPVVSGWNPSRPAYFTIKGSYYF
jgi:hypothetical protein